VQVMVCLVHLAGVDFSMNLEASRTKKRKEEFLDLMCVVSVYGNDKIAKLSCCFFFFFNC
jgi:hypothetical protein